MFGLTLYWTWLSVWADGARSFPDVPANHWVYEGLARAKRDGLVVGSSDGLGYPPREAPTVGELTTRVAFAMSNLRDFAEGMAGERRRVIALESSDERVVAYDADFAALIEMRRHLPFFKASQREFLPQFLAFRKVASKEFPLVGEIEASIGRTLALGLVSPNFVAKNFRDVPADHWAAKAVGDFRVLDLLDGYPDGRFRSAWSKCRSGVTRHAGPVSRTLLDNEGRLGGSRVTSHAATRD